MLQSLTTGATEVAELPSPKAAAGQLLIHTSHTLVSAGTERMLVEFGKANWLDKARQQPDKVRMVLEKVRTDGLAITLEAVQSKLDQPLALGYCNVGVVAEIGSGVEGYAVGDRVASNGKHAEVVCVPKHLCARIPEGVSDEQAAFTVLAAIGLQGVRLANPTLGECVVVTGLGLIGLVTVQLLCAQGCRVLGIDFDPARLALARQFGAEVVDLAQGEDPLAAAAAFSRGRGVDAVIITVSSKSNEPVSQAAKMSRQRGRIVLVGVTGLELSRADFYEKELSFQVSCSYGPGRYDPAYEEGGQDYPIGFVRWTEQRNFEAVLDLMAAGKLDVSLLISHRYALERAVEAYDLLASGQPSLGILLQYPGASAQAPGALARRTLALSSTPGGLPAATLAAGKASVVFLGAGNYASRVLIPAFKA
ncbi:MAG: zinc-dependent alcohol dehydrogenase, partial [Burkholderiales bacterium]